MAETFPSPEQISTSAAEDLGGTTDQRTQIAYLPDGVAPGSSPTITQQDNRIHRFIRRALAGITAGQAYKTGTLEIGVLPLRYRKADGTDVHFEGGTIALTASQTNYVYILVSTNALTKSTTSFPADKTAFIAIAEYVCGGSDITTADDAADRRGLNLYQINASSTSPTGTTSESFTLDTDNTDPELTQQVRFNRGSTDNEDAAWEWDAVNDRFNAKKQHTTGTLCPVNAQKFQVSGTDVVDANGAAKAQAAVAGGGLGHAAGVLSVNVDDSTIEINADTLRLKDAGITAAKLGDTLADKLVQISIGDASGASPQTVTIQAKDIQGNNLAEVVYVRIGVFDDADGTTPAVNATIADGGAGSVVRAITANKDIVFKTDASGTLQVAVTDGTAETIYLLAQATFRSRIMDCWDIGTVAIT